MKRLMLLLLLPLFIYSQEYHESQISLTNEYSVDVPHLSVAGSTVHLIYGTNFYYYRFNINGPSAPIENPVRPAEAWPVTVDIAVDKMDTAHVVIVYNDFKYDYNTGHSYYGCFGIQSTDGGDTWSAPVFLDTVVLGSTYDNIAYNIPAVDFDEMGNFYALWKVHQNGTETNSIYISKNFGQKIRIDDPNKDGFESALALTVTGNMIGVTFARKEGDDVKLYLVYSEANQESFSNEILVAEEGGTFVTQDDFTKIIFGNNENFYIYSTFDTPPTLFLNYGGLTEWQNSGTIDSDNYTYIGFFLHDSHLDKVKLADDGAIRMWTYIYPDWYGNVRLSSPEAQINYAGVFLDLDVTLTREFVVTAWRDSRTGNEEIFYSVTPTLLIPYVEQEPGIPSEFVLRQNFPNPFNPVTKIKYSLPASEFVTLRVYNELGKEIAVLVNEQQNTGNYAVEFNAENLPSGVYFYTLHAGNFIETKKMILLK